MAASLFKIETSEKSLSVYLFKGQSMNEYQRIVKLMRQADSLEKFHVYAVMLVKYLKQTGGKA